MHLPKASDNFRREGGGDSLGKLMSDSRSIGEDIAKNSRQVGARREPAVG